MILASRGTMLQLHEGTAAKHQNKAAITQSTSFQPFHLQKCVQDHHYHPTAVFHFLLLQHHRLHISSGLIHL